jgi:hypothetical protein
MIHVVFNDADAKVMQEVIGLDETLAGEIIVIKDEYEIGPLQNIYVGEGKEGRKEWWMDVLNNGDFARPNDEVDDYKTIAELVGTMRRNEEEIIWIWAAQNSHDVCGYYWILNYMKEFQGRVFILYLNNLPFINEKGNIFYPELLSQIPAKEFLKARKLAREITPSEFEVDPDEWTKLMGDNKGIRKLEGGKKLAQFDYDYFDAELKKFVPAEFQKASKILQQVGTKVKIGASDAYLLWRLKTLAAMQVFEVQGEMGNAKDFELRKV